MDLASIDRLQDAWRQGRTPVDIVDEVVRRIDATADLNAWITVVPAEQLHSRAAALTSDHERGPLWGVPFAVKDNIDVAGLPTTAGCPAYAYIPTATAPVVQRLLDAGAMLVGKTNMDQFATGLSGTRSPYGVCRSVLAPELISGGSSSGSAVAVAAGLVTFALGTDTAGSGRVPAACNGIVGFKPSVGLLPIRGVVPACRSLDCISVFSSAVADAWTVVDVMAGFDEQDAFSRSIVMRGRSGARPRLGVPEALLLTDADALHRSLRSVAESIASALGATLVPFDLRPMREAGDQLYEGAWLAERYSAFGAFIDAHPDDVDPTVARVVRGGREVTGVRVFDDMHRLRELARMTDTLWDVCDAVVLPTVDYVPTIEEMRADPVAANSRLGAFTTGVNPLGLAAIALPAGTTADGRPFGVSLIGPNGSDRYLAELATDAMAAATPGGTDAQRP